MVFKICIHSQAEIIQLGLPALQIQCPSEVPHGKIFRVKISFTNVLHRSLTRVLFLVQAQALCPQRELSHKYIPVELLTFLWEEE